MRPIGEMLGVLLPFRKGPQVLLVPGMRGLLARHIHDKVRARGAEDLATQFESAAGKKLEEIHLATSKAQELNRNRETTKPDLRLALDDLLSLHDNLMMSWTDYRCRLVTQLTADEWSALLSEARPMAFEAWQKRQATIAEWNMTRAEIEKRIRKAVISSERAEQACFKVHEVWTRFSDAYAAENVNPVSHSLVNKHDMDEAEMKNLVSEISRLRGFAYDSYFESHFLLVESTTLAEWEQITGPGFY